MIFSRVSTLTLDLLAPHRVAAIESELPPADRSGEKDRDHTISAD